MQKSRELEFDPGDRSDCKYYNSTSLGRSDTGAVKSFVEQPDETLKSWYADGYTKAATVSSISTLKGAERIQSTTRPKPLFNSCDHTQGRAHNFAYAAVIWKANYVNPTRFGAWYTRYMRKAGTFSSVLLPMPQDTWDAYDDARRRAWWEMQPRFETEIQLLNFIYELKDFKHLCKALWNIRVAEIGGRLRAFWKQLQKSRISDNSPPLQKGIQTLSDLTQVAATERLVEQFAIRPLISDLTAIFTTLAVTIERAQANFANRGNLSQLSHYSENGQTTQTGSYGTLASAPFFDGMYTASTFTATMQYRYKYDLRRGWDLLSHGLGLDFNAEVLWNMIPFSFLVDYIYKVGHALHAVRLDPNTDVQMLQYSESILNSTSSGIMADLSVDALLGLHCPCSRTIGVMVPLTGYTATHYVRRLVNPHKAMYTPCTKPASKGQLWNLAALIRCFFD
jgi:hypothetical protein